MPNGLNTTFFVRHTNSTYDFTMGVYNSNELWSTGGASTGAKPPSTGASALTAHIYLPINSATPWPTTAATRTPQENLEFYAEILKDVQDTGPEHPRWDEVESLEETLELIKQQLKELAAERQRD